MLLITLVFVKLPTPAHSLPFMLSKPILYSGLDVLLGGVIVSKEGENLTYKEIFLSCIMICAFMFGMLFMLQTVVLSDQNASLMPVLAVSDKLHMKWACGVLIAAAIFTTLVSSLKIVSDGVRDFSSNFKRISALSNDENKAIVVFGCLVVAYPLSFFGFDNIVDNLYPFNSVCGVILTCLIVLRYFVRIVSIIVKKEKEKHALKRAKSTLQSSHNSYASHQENPHGRTRKKPCHCERKRNNLVETKRQTNCAR